MVALNNHELAKRINRHGGLEYMIPAAFETSTERYLPGASYLIDLPVFGVVDRRLMQAALFRCSFETSLDSLMRAIVLLKQPDFDRDVFIWVDVKSIKWIGAEDAST